MSHQQQLSQEQSFLHESESEPLSMDRRNETFRSNESEGSQLEEYLSHKYLQQAPKSIIKNFPEIVEEHQAEEEYEKQDNQSKSSQDEEIYLRSDLNLMFDQMAKRASFNLKKLKQSRFQTEAKERKTSKKGEAHKINEEKTVSFKPMKYIQPTLGVFGDQGSRHKQKQRVNTEPLDALFSTSSKDFQADSKKSFKRNQNLTTEASYGEQSQSPKNQTKFLKTGNFDKLMKKKDTNVILKNKTNSSQIYSSNNIGNKTHGESQKLFSGQKSYKFGDSASKQFPSNFQEKYSTVGFSSISEGIKTNLSVKLPAKQLSKRHSLAQSTDKQPIIERSRQTQSVGKRKVLSNTQNQSFTVNPNKNQSSKLSYEALEKKANKTGPLKFKHIENWMNNIIQEYCHEEHFDSSLTNPALKKFYIDSNSLMSNGVDPKDVDRIYKSLFVYSMGFNNLVKEVSKGNRELVKNIWKVFSLMLEYCAAGNYETMVGEMERDKTRKVEALKMEIEKRQKIIERNEEINEEKNMSVFKELKRLKDENTNLSNERQILMEDFQQADQAFNQEVNLRLKFENTINEIYGVHKELSNKHGRLFIDFNGKIEEVKKASEKFFNQAKLTQKYKYDLLELKEKYNELEKVNDHDKLHIATLLEEQNKLKEKYFGNMKELEMCKFINTEKTRKLEQAETEVKNDKIIIELREKSAKETHAEYQITLEENNKLYRVINDQRTQMEGLLKEKKEFNNNVLKILADSSYYKKKLEATDVEILEKNQKIADLENELNKTGVRNDIQLKDIENYKRDLQLNYENIQKMHELNFAMEEELAYLRKYEGNMGAYVADKNQQIEKLTELSEKQEKEMFELKTECSLMVSRCRILEAQIEADRSEHEKRMKEINKEKDNLTDNEVKLMIELNRTNEELERKQKLFDNVLMDFKNEKFERSNLTFAYEQILKVLQKKNQEAKQFAIENNELTEEVNEYKEKYKSTHLKLVTTTDMLTQKIDRITIYMKEMEEEKGLRAQHVHPMEHEDLLVAFNKQVLKLVALEKEYKGYKSKAVGDKMRLERKVKEMELLYEELRTSNEKQLRILKERSTQEVNYERKAKEDVLKRLNDLEMMEKTFKKFIQDHEKEQNANTEMRNSYKKIIEEQSQKYQELMQEAKKNETIKNQQIKHLEVEIKKVEEEKLNFVHQFKTKKEREIREEVEKMYENELEELKKTYQSKEINKIAEEVQSGRNSETLQKYIHESIRSKSLEEILSIKQDSLHNSSHLHDEIEVFYKNCKRQSSNIFSEDKIFAMKTESDAQKREKAIKEKLPAYLQRDKSQNTKRRSDVSRKLKMTYEYYNGTGK